MRTLSQAGLIFVVAAVVFLSSPVYIFGDSHFTLLLSHHILRHGDIRLDEYLAPPVDPRLLRHRPTTRLYQVTIVDGHSYYVYPVGSSILSIPFIPVSEALGLSPVRADGRYDLDGELAMQRRLASLLMAALASLFFLTARLVLTPAWSMIVALGGALGTQVWSTASRVLWSHTWGLVLLGLVVFMLVARERRAASANPFLLATMLAWMYFVRPVHSIAVVTVSAYVILRTYDRKASLQYAVTGAAWLLLYIAYSYHYFGQVLPRYYLPRRFILTPTLSTLKAYASIAAGHLVSPSRGLLVYVPSILFVAYLLARYRRTLPSVPLTVLGLGNVVGLGVVVSAWPVWWGGHSYGPRLLTETVPWLVLLAIMAIGGMLGASAPSTPRARGRRSLELAVGGTLLILSVAIHARGALAWDTVLWNYFPVDVDRRPQRVWAWREAQFLAGAVKPLGPEAEMYDPRRPAPR
jgi:hypothetical protein